MVRYENRCCGCAVPAYPCLGSSCPRRNVEVHYCDKCGEELEENSANGEELCQDCYSEIYGEDEQ